MTGSDFALSTVLVEGVPVLESVCCNWRLDLGCGLGGEIVVHTANYYPDSLQDTR